VESPPISAWAPMASRFAPRRAVRRRGAPPGGATRCEPGASGACPPFALGLAAQVGVLTHLVALVTPAVGTAGAARAVSTATAAAVVGRLLTGAVVDRLNPRYVTSATLAVQIIGLALLAWTPSAMTIYGGCALFGLGVGNLTTLSGLILAREWPRERFSTLVGLVVGINQFTFAFGPSLVGLLRDWTASYGPALGACTVLQAIAAALILVTPRRPARLLSASCRS
jgi:MFS family permease